MATVFFRLWRKLVKMKLLKFQNWFFSHMQLEKAGLIKKKIKKNFSILNPREQKFLVKNLKLTYIMSLKYKNSPLCLRLKPWVN